MGISFLRGKKTKTYFSLLGSNNCRHSGLHKKWVGQKCVFPGVEDTKKGIINIPQKVRTLRTLNSEKKITLQRLHRSAKAVESKSTYFKYNEFLKRK